MAFLTSYSAIKAVIKAKLSALEEAEDKALFAGVYDVNETNPAGYPMAMVIEAAGEASIADTQRNQREWQFDVLIQQEIGNKTPEQAQAILLSTVDAVIAMFDQDWTLADADGDAQALFVRVVPVEFAYGTRETGKHSALLKVAVVNLVNNYASS